MASIGIYLVKKKPQIVDCVPDHNLSVLVCQKGFDMVRVFSGTVRDPNGCPDARGPCGTRLLKRVCRGECAA
jgi:hypothetical protein